MREPSALFAMINGVTWGAHGLIATTGPAYYAPRSGLDYAAVLTYTAGLVLLATCVWWLKVGAGRWVRASAAAAAVGLFTAGVANLFEDGLGLPLGWLYVAAVLVGTVALLAFGVGLLRARIWRRGGLVMATLAGLLLVSSWVGGAVLAFIWIAAGVAAAAKRTQVSGL